MRLLLVLLALAVMVAAGLFLLDPGPVDPGIGVDRIAPADDERTRTGAPVTAPDAGKAREEASGPGPADTADVPVPVDPAPSPDAQDEPSVTTRLTVRWRGPGGDGCTALAIRGHRTFMHELRPQDEAELSTAELVPTEPGVAAATLEGLAFGPWSVGVRSADGSERWAATTLRVEHPERVVEFGAGPSAVRGTVWDRDGRPIEGARITVQCPSASGGATAVRARTGSDGRYEVTGLRGGAGWFSADVSVEGDIEELADHVLSIPQDGSKVVDVGSPVGLATVRLEVVDVAGEPLIAGSVQAIARGGASTVDGTIDRAGRVELELAPATWIFLVWSLDGNKGAHGDLEVVAGGVIEHRIQLAGGRLLGEIEWPEGEPDARARDRQRLTLRSGAEPTSPAVGRSGLDAEGRFRFDAVPPGTYWLTGWPRALASPASATLAGIESTARVTVRLEDP